MPADAEAAELDDLTPLPPAVPPIRARPLPEASLLARHSRPGDHGDCYTVEVPGAVALEAFVEAFYTSRGFLPERLVLYLVGRGASAADARRLARAETDRFAAWRVEAREPRELLLQDWLGRTRSWLMVEPLAGGRTRLCFGSGIIRREGRGLAARVERGLFRALLPGHAVYSRVLLGAAVGQCAK
jgi:AcrR family transcriptional regulator